jgi:hypothetical protein
MADKAGCIVCGIGIISAKDMIFDQDDKWIKYHANPGVLFLDAEEIEKKYFTNHSHWQGLYRLSEFIFSVP